MEVDQSSQESVEATVPVAINIKNTEPITKQKKARRQKRKNNRMKMPYFSSKKEQVKSFLDEVRKQFKDGNLPLYEQAVKNLEQHYENVAQNGNIVEEKVGFRKFFSRLRTINILEKLFARGITSHDHRLKITCFRGL